MISLQFYTIVFTALWYIFGRTFMRGDNHPWCQHFIELKLLYCIYYEKPQLPSFCSQRVCGWSETFICSPWVIVLDIPLCGYANKNGQIRSHMFFWNVTLTSAAYRTEKHNHFTLPMPILLYLTASRDIGLWSLLPVVVISAQQQCFAFCLPLNLSCRAQRKPINTCVCHPICRKTNLVLIRWVEKMTAK